MDRVYILECNDFYKIWYTSQKDVNMRVKQMKTWNPFPISIVREYLRYDNDGKGKECLLHSIYSNKRKSLEWFDLDSDDLMAIDDLMYIEKEELELLQRKDVLKNEISELEKQKKIIRENKINIEYNKIHFFKNKSEIAESMWITRPTLDSRIKKWEIILNRTKKYNKYYMLK